MTLDDLLGAWSARYRLSEAQSAAVRAVVLTAARNVELDPDWLWDLLKPVTGLLDGPNRLRDTVGRPYLRLA
jgi:hypothetical protein